MEERMRTIKTIEKTIAAFLLKVSGDSMAGEGIMEGDRSINLSDLSWNCAS